MNTDETHYLIGKIQAALMYLTAGYRTDTEKILNDLLVELEAEL